MKVGLCLKNTFRILCTSLCLVSVGIQSQLRGQEFYEDEGWENNVVHPSIEKDTQVCTKVLNETCCDVDNEANCESDNQAGYEHWLLNRKMLLVAVPVLAGGVAVALAASSRHNVSYYTGYPYYSYYGYYDEGSYDNSYYYSDDSYSHHHHHSHHSHDSHHTVNITSTLFVENIVGSVTLTASFTMLDGTVIESSALTLIEPGVFTFGTLKIDEVSKGYQINLAYTLDAVSSIQGSLTTTISLGKEVSSEKTDFTGIPNQVGAITQSFQL